MNSQKILDILKVKFLTGKNRKKYWTRGVVTLVVALLFVYSSNLVDKKVLYTLKLNDQVKELKSEYVDLRSQLQRIRLESTVKQELEAYGLEHSEHPPQKIKVIVP